MKVFTVECEYLFHALRQIIGRSLYSTKHGHAYLFNVYQVHTLFLKPINGTSGNTRQPH